MATSKFTHVRPSVLLGRTVTGCYRSGDQVIPFYGMVEAVVIPVPGSVTHQVEFYVSGEYVSLSDCIQLDFPPATVLPAGQLGA